MRHKTIKQIKVYLLTIIVTIGITVTAVGQHNHVNKRSTPLTMPGNEVFGTIQEVVKKLEADPDTDWSKVNLEALRQHLLDMKAFTEEVEVLSNKPFENGVKIQVRPKSQRAGGALKRLFSMHPAMLKKEKGWIMETRKKSDRWTITFTTNEESDIGKIRGLGYIGLMAAGAHHQSHHWMIATGKMKMEFKN